MGYVNDILSQKNQHQKASIEGKHLSKCGRFVM
jgi:hypothetical protein